MGRPAIAASRSRNLAGALVLAAAGAASGGGAVVCPTDGWLRCGSPLLGTTIDHGANLSGYSCAEALEAGGEEAVFRFTSQTAGEVTVQLSGMATDHDLYVLEATLDPDNCIAAEVSPGTTDVELAFVADPGTDYFIVVEAFAGAVGGFALDTTTGDATGCPESCANGIDDDNDGDIDCDDADCDGEYACGTVFLDDLEGGNFSAWSCRPEA